jgi:GTP-binding protein YchF
MKIGLIGLKQSGKTTIFSALTRSESKTLFDNKKEPNVGKIQVLDPRIKKLVQIYQPKKTTYTSIDCIDFDGFQEEKSKGISTAELGLIKNLDALALVVRNFNDDMINETLGKPDPIRDVEKIKTELILSDLIVAENRMERIEHSLKRGLKTPALENEKKIIEKALECLHDEKPIASIGLSKEDKKQISGFQFLSMKPILVIVNSFEDNLGKNEELLASLTRQYMTIEFAGRFEMELSGLSDEDALVFMEDMKINASARDRLSMCLYDLLGYISFFTVGEDEVRAWTIEKGDTALDAAAAIHSDLARGFIRAERFTYDDLITHGSEKTLKSQGLFYLEGKTYQVKDGDILNIRFNV